SLDGGESAFTLATIGGGILALAYGQASLPWTAWVLTGNNPSVHRRLQLNDQIVDLPNQPNVLPNTGDHEGVASGDIALSPRDSQTVYIAANSQVFVTQDGGSSWQDITGDLTTFGAGPLHAIEYVKSLTGDRIFVAGTPGVYMMSIANPGVWVRAGTGLPNAV